jgi:hypothetical protein
MGIVTVMQSLNTHSAAWTGWIRCADCGEEITDLQDVDYTVHADGYVSALHTDAYHREMYPDDETGPSPYEYYEQRLAAERIRARNLPSV